MDNDRTDDTRHSTRHSTRHLGRLTLDARLPARDRGDVPAVSRTWRLAGGGASLEPAVVDDLDTALLGLRLIIREVLSSRGIGLDGVVVLELPEGLVKITATGRRVCSRWLSTTPVPSLGTTAEVAACRVIRLADRRARVARRESPWVG